MERGDRGVRSGRVWPKVLPRLSNDVQLNAVKYGIEMSLLVLQDVATPVSECL